MKFKIKTILNISLIVIIFLTVFIYILKVEGAERMLDTLKGINIWWCIIGFLFIFLYWFFEALCLYIVERKMYKNQSFIDSFRVTMIGQLFNSITPFASGGQVCQAAAMKYEGKTVSDSASILLIKFILYQLTLVIYTLVIIIFQYSYFKTLVTGFVRLALIGFLVNFVVICFLILIGINKKFVLKLCTFFYKVLYKMRIIKDIDEKLNMLNDSIESFSNNFKIIIEEKRMSIGIIFITFLELTVFFAITFAIYKMFGLNGAGVTKIISAQAFLSMVMAFVPIPGAGIAAEGGFHIIFKNFFTPSTINVAILIWRFFSLYLPIIVGVIFLISLKRRSKYMNNEKA